MSPPKQAFSNHQRHQRVPGIYTYHFIQFYKIIFLQADKTETNILWVHPYLTNILEVGLFFFTIV